MTIPNGGVGSTVRRLREERGLSMSELARQAGVGISTVLATERGKTSPTESTVRKLAIAFGVSLQIIYGVEPSEISVGETIPGLENRLGKHVRALRKAIGITMEELATRAGTSDACVAHTENGGNPREITVRKLANGLDVPLRILLQGYYNEVAVRPYAVLTITNGKLDSCTLRGRGAVVVYADGDLVMHLAQGQNAMATWSVASSNAGENNETVISIVRGQD